VPILAIYFSRRQAVCRSKCCLCSGPSIETKRASYAASGEIELKFETVLPDFWGPNLNQSAFTCYRESVWKRLNDASSAVTSKTDQKSHPLATILWILMMMMMMMMMMMKIHSSKKVFGPL
jgi:hypothetical protein